MCSLSPREIENRGLRVEELRPGMMFVVLVLKRERGGGPENRL